jgi:hypothetical protein
LFCNHTNFIATDHSLFCTIPFFFFHLASLLKSSPSILLVNLLLSFKRCFGSVLQWTRRENKLMFMAQGNQAPGRIFSVYCRKGVKDGNYCCYGVREK